jgi:hypothetical protein
MRNLLEYPITKDEIIQTLQECLEDEIKQQQQKNSCGDIKGVCLREAIRLIDTPEVNVRVDQHFEGGITCSTYLTVDHVTQEDDNSITAIVIEK